MDASNSEIRHKKALENYLRSLEQLSALTFTAGVSGKIVNDTRLNVRNAWARLGATHRELVDAYLEKMGW